VSGGGGEGGLMRPTKSWLHHLGEQAGGKVPSTPPTLNGTGTAATKPAGSADEGPAATTRKNSSQKANPDSSSSSSASSSSGDKMLTSSTSSSSSDSSSSGKSKALKEKIAMANNNNKAASNLVNGKETCQNGTVQGKEGHTATEKKELSVTINGGKESAKRPDNGNKGGRTTMMIRLHPGRTNKLSAYLESQEKPGSRTWLTEALTEEVKDALCGLEISFSSVPQDIDIKLLPPTQGDGHLEDIEK